MPVKVKILEEVVIELQNASMCVGCFYPLSAKSYRRDVSQAKVNKTAHMEKNIALLMEWLSTK